MNVQHPDIKIRYIRTKNKTRKLVTYMIQQIRNLGFFSLKELIDSLD